ncbi:Porin subfamily protein [Methylobacterium sp. 174MFSha1.1]|uniref:porin n=1 Tax=Methylobacterium sp. 174MFSha1.1 TaxID=1502749 RepID=UPI0008EA12F5|nr:porin [Methylobacterium sp. 174MFSha1.1]SFU53815.1 Porin subfamily protein [Methylobacterium sp. 174MFSha1.1]
MRTTSMILAVAALFAASSAALPAHALDVRDLPIAKAPEACPHEGPGFTRVVPGGPCMRISGRVRAEVGTPVPARPGAGLDGAARGVVSASGRVAIDTRTQTEYGPARAYIRLGTSH